MAYGLSDRWWDADGVGFCVGKTLAWKTLALKTEYCFSTSRIWHDAFCPFRTRPHIYSSGNTFEAG